jgi:hypothetical protein
MNVIEKTGNNDIIINITNIKNALLRAAGGGGGGGGGDVSSCFLCCSIPSYSPTNFKLIRFVKVAYHIWPTRNLSIILFCCSAGIRFFATSLCYFARADLSYRAVASGATEQQ